ncbi:GNAT family N-acetyltransferase [Paenibacillus koleovorans]|uniref:GNAT family N-acetyltransferase n=1 Tax=Paenibacillus koleovorans TaxID=121608 RepID=UPI000FD974E2|nr:GNAT family N-acetyltransferase [Paenibacillus koleovorans]
MNAIEIRTMSQCTVDEITALWNVGFQHYLYDMTRTPFAMLNSLGKEYIHPELSIAAFIDGVPAGFVNVGIRVIEGRILAWNGGTGVNPAFRGRGLSKQLVTEIIRRLKAFGAESFTLEVNAKNDPGIRSYSSCGLTIVDGLFTMRRKGDYEGHPFRSKRAASYRFHQGAADLVSRLPFYCSEHSSWTTQWFNLESHQSLIVYDRMGNAIGYALFRQQFNERGGQVSVNLNHCEADSSREDHPDIILALLEKVMTPEAAGIDRNVTYLRASNKAAVEALLAAGFENYNEEKLMVMRLDK